MKNSSVVRYGNVNGVLVLDDIDVVHRTVVTAVIAVVRAVLAVHDHVHRAADVKTGTAMVSLACKEIVVEEEGFISEGEVVQIEEIMLLDEITGIINRYQLNVRKRLG